MDVAKSRFYFKSFIFDQPSRTARFEYSVTLHNGKQHTFAETLTFTTPFPSDRFIDAQQLEPFLLNLHLMLGISYWKAFCSIEIVLENQTLTPKQAEFWNTVYTKGLGEFFYKNKIDFRSLIKFPSQAKVSLPAQHVGVQDQALLGIGGGKDSIVAGELLKKMAYPYTGFVIETQTKYPIIHTIIDTMGVGSLYVKRTLDPLLFSLNASGAVYNGHIPISAIYAHIGILTAFLYGYQYFIVPNEHSANVGNTEYLGASINHQWSKSHEFEKLFQSYVQAYITPDVRYVSVLRPLTELEIMNRFSHFPQYFNLFSSCNNNFKVEKAHKKATRTLWCGSCPKCAFVFVAMSAFLPIDTVVKIFGKHMLEDSSLIPLYKELLGLSELKPFECVGTFEETQAAFILIHKKKEAEMTPVMLMFLKESLPKIPSPDKLVEQQGTPDPYIKLPEKFQNIIHTL